MLCVWCWTVFCTAGGQGLGYFWFRNQSDAMHCRHTPWRDLSPYQKTITEWTTTVGCYEPTSCIYDFVVFPPDMTPVLPPAPSPSVIQASTPS